MPHRVKKKAQRLRFFGLKDEHDGMASPAGISTQRRVPSHMKLHSVVKNLKQGSEKLARCHTIQKKAQPLRFFGLKDARDGIVKLTELWQEAAAFGILFS